MESLSLERRRIFCQKLCKRLVFHGRSTIHSLLGIFQIFSICKFSIKQNNIKLQSTKTYLKSILMPKNTKSRTICLNFIEINLEKNIFYSNFEWFLTRIVFCFITFKINLLKIHFFTQNQRKYFIKQLKFQNCLNKSWQ